VCTVRLKADIRAGARTLPALRAAPAVYGVSAPAPAPQQRRRLHPYTLVTRGIASRDIFTPSTHLCCLGMCLTSAPGRTLATGRNVSATAHMVVRQPQAAVASQPLTAPPAAGPRPAGGGWPACRWPWAHSAGTGLAGLRLTVRQRNAVPVLPWHAAESGADWRTLSTISLAIMGVWSREHSVIPIFQILHPTSLCKPHHSLDLCLMRFLSS
jgi:hypothetical protein